MYLVKNDKSRFYQIVYSINGKRTTVSTKTANKEKAETFLDNFKKGLFEPAQKQIQLITLSKFRDEYISFICTSKSKHYVRSVKLSFDMLIKFTGDIPLNRLDLRTLDKFINTTFARAQKAAALYYRTLKAAFSKAVVWEYLTENPLKKIKSPKVVKQLPVFITLTELQLIIANTQEQYLKDLFLAAFYTGMRLGELVNMKWDWIDLNQNIITIQCSEIFTTKSKKERIVPISPTLKNCLMNRLPKILAISKNEFVFTRCPEIKLNEDFVSKKFKEVIRELDFNDKIHFHTLRHSFASLLVQRGVSLYIVKELLGHESLVTTQIYSHLQKDNLRDAVNLL
ncbi:MAG: tyrosine-type recombinase/integrase [Ignavibacteria bacterium]|nr:tyrosine-type recombinase/integrase [Ignavibacteria bacterium]